MSDFLIVSWCCACAFSLRVFFGMVLVLVLVAMLKLNMKLFPIFMLRSDVSRNSCVSLRLCSAPLCLSAVSVLLMASTISSMLCTLVSLVNGASVCVGIRQYLILYLRYSPVGFLGTVLHVHCAMHMSASDP